MGRTDDTCKNNDRSLLALTVSRPSGSMFSLCTLVSSLLTKQNEISIYLTYLSDAQRIELPFVIYSFQIRRITLRASLEKVFSKIKDCNQTKGGKDCLDVDKQFQSNFITNSNHVNLEAVTKKNMDGPLDSKTIHLIRENVFSKISYAYIVFKLYE